MGQVDQSAEVIPYDRAFDGAISNLYRNFLLNIDEQARKAIPDEMNRPEIVVAIKTLLVEAALRRKKLALEKLVKLPLMV